MFQFTFCDRAIFELAWLLHKGDWIPPTFYPCPDMTGTPDAACVLTAPGNQLSGGDPFYKTGAKPSAGNGRLHQLENLLDHPHVLDLPPAVELLGHRHLLQLRPFREHVKLHVTPQIHHQPPRHRDNSDPPHPCPATGESPFIPLAQLAVGLQP
jgi:hypothetical protein